MASLVRTTLVFVLLTACGDDSRATGGATTTGPTTSSTTASGTGGASTGTTADPSSGGAPTTSGVTTVGPTTDPTATTGTTAATTEASATGSTDAPGTTGDTGPVCDPNSVPDVLQFDYVRTIDIGLTGIQASYYNIAAQEMVFLSYGGQGKRVALDGTVLGDVTAPPGVSMILDGATYDQVNQTALLVDQKCNFGELDPVTLAPISIVTLDAKFGLNICSGLAIGLDGNLYLTSTLTDEVVVITRDLQTEVARFKVDDDGLTNVDGISLIAGSENFLVLSTYDLKAAIFSPAGDPVVPASTIGGMAPPLVGGDMPMIPDAVLTVCGNGHAWVCEGLEKVGCYEYAPQGGDADSCPCVIPG